MRWYSLSIDVFQKVISLNFFGEVVMVSQAASQTRFRALKHESGIDGSATIIVRVIACFQPLQDCQLPHVHFRPNISDIYLNLSRRFVSFPRIQVKLDFVLYISILARRFNKKSVNS
ncbi:hypothetical protein SASPL_124676 [Salvia splendens]|uniref:Uncharacterized protein n=1 Tax=Salvia splendens TaxID=180675 RepID=A0A8X8ZPC2_SALSN|nr:hypothetical protein SASPL_124676 [Salvia splendens]